jgi:beta-lactamase class A
VGKDYAKQGLWKRDPMHNLSHGATAMQVARFYYLLETERLVSPEHSRLMKDIMGGSEHIQHKFVSSLTQLDPEAEILRKSGSWRTYHADSVLVKRKGRAYIAVALSDDENGRIWLQKLIYELDAIIMARHPQPGNRSRN